MKNLTKAQKVILVKKMINEYSGSLLALAKDHDTYMHSLACSDCVTEIDQYENTLHRKISKQMKLILEDYGDILNHRIQEEE